MPTSVSETPLNESSPEILKKKAFSGIPDFRLIALATEDLETRGRQCSLAAILCGGSVRQFGKSMDVTFPYDSPMKCIIA